MSSDQRRTTKSTRSLVRAEKRARLFGEENFSLSFSFFLGFFLCLFLSLSLFPFLFLPLCRFTVALLGANIRHLLPCLARRQLGRSSDERKWENRVGDPERPDSREILCACAFRHQRSYSFLPLFVSLSPSLERSGSMDTLRSSLSHSLLLSSSVALVVRPSPLRVRTPPFFTPYLLLFFFLLRHRLLR